MEISRLILTKETKEMTTKNISSHVKAKLLYEKLQEVSDKGTLAMCRSRKEVGSVLGYTEERQSAGYIWVSKMIRDGYLNESIYGENIYGKIEYQYHLSKKKPSYMTKTTKKRSKKAEVVEKQENKVVEIKEKKSPMTKITIASGDLKMELEQLPLDLIKDLVVDLFNKTKGA